MVRFWANAQGAIVVTVLEATSFKFTVPETSKTMASSRATRRSCSTSRFMRATSDLSLERSPLPSITSSAAVMMASGVRSSWAAFAVNWRWTAKPCSRRSNAWFTATTKGVISLGRFSSGNRTDVVLGPIVVAISETARTGLSPLRTAKIPMPSVTRTRSGMTQAMSTTNSRRSECISASAPAERATEIESGPAILLMLMLRP